MKINIIAGFVIALGLLSSFRPNQPQDSPEQLKAVVSSYFEGIENVDTARMRAVTTSDFILYEDGRVWNNDSAFMNIRRHLPFTVKYKLDHFKINVDTKSGDMTYTNHADFVFRNSQKLSLDWIESATFRKEDGVWKMNFLQVTIRK
jgi:hypothetical protein